MPTGVYRRVKPIWNKGKKMSDDFRIKCRDRQLGRANPHTEEWNKKISAAHIGRKRGLMSEEHKNKIREAHIKRGTKAPSTKGRIQSPEERRKRSEMMRGDKAPNWQGGKVAEHRIIRTSVEYKLWREAVFKRDNYQCIWCGARSGKGKSVEIQADHIKPFAQFPELRFAIDNGRTLCRPCHQTTETWGRPVKKTTP